MSESATSLREQRRRETSESLSAAARDLTIERGLAGFTIDEVCSAAGVSRRTFFNYFASKEHAVLGLALADDREQALEAEFTATPGPVDQLLPALLDLMIGRWAFSDPPQHHVRMAELVEKEPRLLGRVLEIIDTYQQHDIGLVARRQGWDETDDRAVLAVHILGAILRSSFTEFMGADPETILAALRRRLDVVALLSPTTSPAPTTSTTSTPKDRA